MLVSLLLPMATPPAQAQMINPADLAEFFGEEIKKPTPIIVLDLMDRSGRGTGMLGRTLSDALAIELTNTSTFEVIKRSEVERVMEEFRMAVPLGSAAQSMLADRLKCSYVLSGDINSVQVVRGREGTYAEVDASVLVIHKATQLPINGAHVIVRSSPKIGYSGNEDVLVHEALAIAGYQITQKLMNNRLPIATVLNTPRTGELIMRGGSQLGFRKGMILTTVRRGQVTGRARITLVNPAESYGEVLEDNKGIAPGDKAVPIFEFETSSIMTKEIRDRAGLQIAGLLMLTGLAVLVGTENGNKQLQNKPPVPTVTAMADAVVMGDTDGANLVSWPWQGARVLAYLIYRDTNPYAPVAVVDGHTYNWRDSCLPLPEIGTIMESTTVNISIDESTGVIQEFSYDTSYETSPELLRNDEMSLDPSNLTITTRRMPLVPGEKVGYRIRLLYMDYIDEGLDGSGDFPQSYSLFLGNIGPTSVRVTATKPPVLFQPVENGIPTDGIYRCSRVPVAMNYTLQVAIVSSTFEAKYRLPLRGVVPHIEGDDYVAAFYSLSQLYNEVAEVQQRLGIPPSSADTVIYWRMGARVAGEPQPTALADPNYNGWVFSKMRIFVLPPVPPSLPSIRYRGGRPGVPKLPMPGRTRGGLFQRR
jgi:TolB-like protein